jgi:hypothetical protein
MMAVKAGIKNCMSSNTPHNDGSEVAQAADNLIKQLQDKNTWLQQCREEVHRDMDELHKRWEDYHWRETTRMKKEIENLKYQLDCIFRFQISDMHTAYNHALQNPDTPFEQYYQTIACKNCKSVNEPGKENCEELLNTPEKPQKKVY